MILNNDYDFRINEIENLTYEQAYILGENKAKIKEHDIIFCVLGKYFGYSALVFYNGKHIYHADLHELHYPSCMGDKKALHERYIEILNHKLYTDDELSTVSDYDDYQAKLRYLHNYYPMREDYISNFFIGSDEERERLKKQVEDMHYNPIGFCYMDNKAFIKRHIELYNNVNKAWENIHNDFETLKNAFLKEMHNHEYPINWQADYDVLSCFYNVPYIEGGTREYLNYLKLSDTEINAYMTARNECIEYFNNMN